MLFKRRDRERFTDRARVWFWPRRSWGRSVRYVKNRVMRLKGTPHFIALGCVTGVFVSFTPYIGLHFLIAAAIAWMIGGSMIASALGTFFGNPLTFPFIWRFTYEMGDKILGTHVSKENVDFSANFIQPSYDSLWSFADSIIASIEKLWPLLKTMTVGAMPLGFVMAVLLYYPVRKGISSYQNSRFKRLATRRQKLADDKAEEKPPGGHNPQFQAIT